MRRPMLSDLAHHPLREADAELPLRDEHPCFAHWSSEGRLRRAAAMSASSRIVIDTPRVRPVYALFACSCGMKSSAALVSACVRFSRKVALAPGTALSFATTP